MNFLADNPFYHCQFDKIPVPRFPMRQGLSFFKDSLFEDIFNSMNRDYESGRLRRQVQGWIDWEDVWLVGVLKELFQYSQTLLQPAAGNQP